MSLDHTSEEPMGLQFLAVNSVSGVGSSYHSVCFIINSVYFKIGKIAQWLVCRKLAIEVLQKWAQCSVILKGAGGILIGWANNESMLPLIFKYRSDTRNNTTESSLILSTLCYRALVQGMECI